VNKSRGDLVLTNRNIFSISYFKRITSTRCGGEEFHKENLCVQFCRGASVEKNSWRNEQRARVHSEGNIKKTLVLKGGKRAGENRARWSQHRLDTKFHFLVGQSCLCGVCTMYTLNLESIRETQIRRGKLYELHREEPGKFFELYRRKQRTDFGEVVFHESKMLSCVWVLNSSVKKRRRSFKIAKGRPIFVERL
jgi:hypothetical protein